MKVVFIEDVPDVALAGETREVADGYGRNYLLPKKLAVLADSAASNILKAQMKQVLVKRAQAEAEMKEVAGKLDGTGITIRAKAGEKERLYGSVTSADIAAELSSISGVAIDKRKIDLEEPIRQLGEHEVTLKFTHDIAAIVKVTVEAEAVTEEKEEKEEKKPRAKKAEKAGEAEDIETKAEEAKAEIEAKPEVAEATEAETEAAAVKVEETEIKEEAAEAVAEKPKTKKKTKKKTEAKEEKPEAEAEEPKAEVEEKETGE